MIVFSKHCLHANGKKIWYICRKKFVVAYFSCLLAVMKIKSLEENQKNDRKNVCVFGIHSLNKITANNFWWIAWVYFYTPIDAFNKITCIFCRVEQTTTKKFNSDWIKKILLEKKLGKNQQINADIESINLTNRHACAHIFQLFPSNDGNRNNNKFEKKKLLYLHRCMVINGNKIFELNWILNAFFRSTISAEKRLKVATNLWNFRGNGNIQMNWISMVSCNGFVLLFFDLILLVLDAAACVNTAKGWNVCAMCISNGLIIDQWILDASISLHAHINPLLFTATSTRTTHFAVRFSFNWLLLLLLQSLLNAESRYLLYSVFPLLILFHPVFTSFLCCVCFWHFS